MRFNLPHQLQRGLDRHRIALDEHRLMQVKAMVAAINAGNWAEAKRLHLQLLDLHQAMFIESNPVPVKTSLELMGKIAAHVRLPLVPLQATSLTKLTAVLKKQGLL